jgi:hypothetical protein
MTQHPQAVHWILGSLLAVSGAAAAALTSEPASAPVSPPGTSANETRLGAVSTPPATPAATATPAASLPGGTAPLPAATPPPAGAAIGGAHSPLSATDARTPLPPGQVWQCVIDGERIFSDAPCGAHASIRQLGELNVMDAPPVQSYAHAYPYAPTSAPAPPFAPVPADDSGYGDYSGPEVLWVRGYARRNYFPRQDNPQRPQPQPKARPHPHPRRN